MKLDCDLDDGFSVIGREDLGSMTVRRLRPIRTFFGKDWEGGKTGLLRGVYSNHGKMEAALRLINEGKNSSEIGRAIHIHPHTVSKIRRIIENHTGTRIKCPCGRLIEHLGTCWYRVKPGARHSKFVAKEREKLKASIAWHKKRIAAFEARLKIIC